MLEIDKLGSKFSVSMIQLEKDYVILKNNTNKWKKQIFFLTCFRKTFVKIIFALQLFFFKEVQVCRNAIIKSQRFPQIRNNEEVKAIATQIEEQITEFKPKLFLITSLAQEGLRPRHWKSLSDKVNYNHKVLFSLLYFIFFFFDLLTFYQRRSKVNDTKN